MARSTRRLRWRHLLVVLVVVLLGWAVHVIHRRMTASPAPVVDYGARLVQLSAAHQPSGEDGWKHFIDAAAKLDEMQLEVMELALERRDDHDAGGAEFWRVLEGPFDASRLENEIRGIEMLRANGALDLLARAAAAPRAVRTMPAGVAPMATVPLPGLALLRQMAKARVASMRLAAAGGDTAGLVEALEQSLALGRGAAVQSLLIDHLVGYAIYDMAMDELQRLLAEHRLAPAEYEALLEVIDRQVRFPPADLAMEGERTLGLDAIQWCFTDDGHGDGRLQPSRFNQMTPFGAAASGGGSQLLGAMTGVFMAGRAETTELLNAFYDRCIAESRLTAAARLDSVFDPRRFLEGLSPRHMFVRAMLPATGKAMLQRDVCRLEVEGTRLMIAIEHHRAVHGAYPSRLDNLVPGPLGQLPPDPLHGGDFRYHLRDDGSSYLLYTTGLDQTDDAAAGHPDPDDAATRFADDVSTPGSDVLINVERPEPPQ